MTTDAQAVVPPSLAQTLALLEQRFPEREVAVKALGGGSVSYRTCGNGQPVVLLHGIGSGAASWLPCALALGQDMRVIAWNAPGYGRSTPLQQAAPLAVHYASRLAQFLEALALEDCVLVGHSLGAIMAAAYAAADVTRLARLVLLSPAQGYGADDKRQRGNEVFAERLNTLERLGIAGMAQQRSSRMLTPSASEEAREWVRWNMGQLNPQGYVQAVHMLCGDDIRNYLPAHLPARVFCGAADVITTPQNSLELANGSGLPFDLIAGAGHACYIEQPDSVAAAILQTA